MSKSRNRTALHGDRGYSAVEVIGGALVLSILISICGWLIGYVQFVKGERRANSPFRKQQQEQGVKEVHPGDEYAKRVENSSGKTECWIILGSDAGCGIYLGFKEGIDKNAFQKAARK